MKYALLLFVGFAFISCDKSEFDKEYEVCKNKDYEDPDVIGAEFDKYVLDELVYNEDGCIIEGSIKYMEDAHDVIVVKYYQKDGITQGHKTYYDDYEEKCGFGMSGKKGKDDSYGCTFRPVCESDENINTMKSAE